MLGPTQLIATVPKHIPELEIRSAARKRGMYPESKQFVMQQLTNSGNEIHITISPG